VVPATKISTRVFESSVETVNNKRFSALDIKIGLCSLLNQFFFLNETYLPSTTTTTTTTTSSSILHWQKAAVSPSSVLNIL
jgi:hypothetical protein